MVGILKERRAELIPGDVIDQKCPSSTPVVGASNTFEALLSRLSNYLKAIITVSQIYSLMFLLVIWMVLAPNSTPIVRSCCYLNLLSVN